MLDENNNQNLPTESDCENDHNMNYKSKLNTQR